MQCSRLNSKGSLLIPLLTKIIFDFDNKPAGIQQEKKFDDACDDSVGNDTRFSQAPNSPSRFANRCESDLQKYSTWLHVYRRNLAPEQPGCQINLHKSKKDVSD